MELIECEQTLNTIFPKVISIIIVDYSYGYEHHGRHHTWCNIQKDKSLCNCLLRLEHTGNCVFTRVNIDMCNIHYLTDTVSGFCTCTKIIPKIIICNNCFKCLNFCCGYKCVFCFICHSCGNGHPFVNLIV